MKKKVLIALLVVIIIIVAVLIAVNLTGEKEETVIAGETIKTENNISVKYDGVDITPGEIFDESAISKEYELSEIPSCAFDGTDKVYTYDDVEITVAEVDGVNTVYSVYFITDGIETNENVKISDSKDLMIEIYGDNYNNTLENVYDYNYDELTLSFIVENDTITSIEYILDV